jgi:hypothetical protein
MVIFEAVGRQSIRGTEIPHVLESAGASEFVFDGQTQSKEDLLSTSLKDRHAVWMRWFENEIEARYEATRGGLEIIADILQQGFEDPKRFGFAFAYIFGEGCELKPKPYAIARNQKEHLGGFLRQLTAEMGLQHPDIAASAAVFVIERTIERTLTTGSPKEAQAARLLFRRLHHA